MTSPKKLVLHKDKELPEIFAAELKKHDTDKGYIEQNLNAQTNIIKAITEVNAKYAPTRRKVADLIDARREKISSLIDSFAVYENLTVKSSKALEFYEKLNTNVGDLQKKVSEAMEENEREKDAVIAKLAPPKPVTPSAPVPSSRPTLKDYINAGGVPRPSVPGGIPYPGYINPATTSHQGYQQPPNTAATSHQGYQQPPNPATTSHQGYQQPPMMYQQAQPQARFQQPGYPRQFPPTTGQNYPYSTGYQVQTGQMGQRFPNQRQQQQFYPGYPQPQQPQLAPTPHQQGLINPNDLSLI